MDAEHRRQWSQEDVEKLIAKHCGKRFVRMHQDAIRGQDKELQSYVYIAVAQKMLRHRFLDLGDYHYELAFSVSWRPFESLGQALKYHKLVLRGVRQKYEVRRFRAFTEEDEETLFSEVLIGRVRIWRRR